MKNRILISNIIVIIVIILSKPDSFKNFYLGLPFVILGETIRVIASFCIRKNNVLAVNGIYAVTRNPLYLGTFLIVFGVLLQIFSVLHLTVTIFLWLFVILSFLVIYYHTIKAEEKFLFSKFGQEYFAYCKNVPVLIPDFTKMREVFKTENYSKETFLKNKEYRGFLAVVIIEIVIYLKICLK